MLLALAAALAGGQGTASAQPMPAMALDDPVIVDAGRARFDSTCTFCHGPEGTSGRAPNFKGRQDLTPARVFEVISEGRKRGSNLMPAWKGSLDDRTRWELVGCIMSLTKRPADDQQ